MTCPCSNPAPENRTQASWRLLARTARAVLGVPDYDAYLAHAAAAHPDRAPLTRDAFFAAKQATRYGGGGFRCC